MATYTSTVMKPDGTPYKIEGPDGVKQADVDAEVMRQHPHASSADAEPPKQNAAIGALAALNNGMLLGAGPKVSGFLDYLQHGGKNSLHDEIAAEEKSSQQFAGDHPMVSGAANATGAIAGTFAPVGKLLGPAIRAGEGVWNAARGAVMAGGLGGVSAAASSPVDSSATDVLNNTVKGTVAGTATGAVAGPLVAGANAGLSKAFGGAAGDAADAFLGPLQKLRAYTGAKLGDPAPLAPPAPQSPPGPMPPGPAPMAAPPMPPPATGPLGGVRGVGAILSNMERDGTSPEALRIALQQRVALGKPGSIAAVSEPGGNVQQRGKTAFLMPGAGKVAAAKQLNDSVTGMPARVAGNVDEMAGMPGIDTEEAQASLNASKKAAMGPAYTEAFAQGEVNDPELNAQLTLNPAYEDAHELMRAQQQKSGNIGTAAPPLFDGKGGLARAPTVRDLDMIKKGLDAQVRDAGGGLKMSAADQTKKESIGNYEDARSSLMDIVNPLTPKYTAARQQFGNVTEIENAFQDGRDLMMKGANASPAEVKRQLGMLSYAGKQAFRQGVQDSIKRSMYSIADKSPASTASEVVGSGEGTRMQMIRAVFGDGPETTRLLAQMKAEQANQQTRNFTMGGSHTAANVAGMADSLGEDATAVAHGPKTATLHFGQKALNFVNGVLQQGNNAAIADQLYKPRTGFGDDDFFKAMDELAAKRRARLSGDTAGLNVMVGVVGNRNK